MSELDATLEQRLPALPVRAAGDWDDVIARSRQVGAARSHKRRLTLAFAALALLLVSGTAFAIGRQLGWFTVNSVDRQAPTLPEAASYIAGQTLFRAGAAPQRLAYPLAALLLGQDATLVVSSPDKRYLVYHSWLQNVPLLVVHDTTTGRDRVLARGAQTVAWARDGRIAYVQALKPHWQSNHAFRGRVVVTRLASRTVSTPLSKVGSYEVMAWAGDRLLVRVPRCLLLECNGNPEVGVYVLQRSGRLRPLHLATLAALSPDGRFAFGRFDTSPGGDNPSSLVRLVDVARGRVVATLDLARAMRKAGFRGLLSGSMFNASWRGTEIVANIGGRDSGLAFIRVVANRLEVESVVRVGATTLPAARYGVSFGPPVFTGSGTDAVVVPVRGTSRGDKYLVAILACTRSSRHCTGGGLLAPRNWFAVVANPSRP